LKKQPLTIFIAGQRYVIHSEADETYVHNLAEYVNEQIQDVQQSAKPIAPHRLAVLAALNIADELFQEQKLHAQLKSQVRDKTRTVLSYLDQEVEKRRAQQN